MVENQKNSALWRRLVALLRDTVRWQRVKRAPLPASIPPSSPANTVNEEEIRKRLEGLGYIE
jgi:hypothetical protein